MTQSRVELPSGTLTDADPTSVSIHPTGKFALITIRDASAAAGTADEKPGIGVFVEIGANGAITVLNAPILGLGYRPEAVDIAANGEYAVVANEGTAAIAGSGTVQIVDLNANGSVAGSAVARELTPTKTGVNEPDPEAVAISPDSRRAYVTLQTPGDIMVVNVNATNLGSSTQTTVDLRQATSHPDGIAVTPDNQYVITANEETNQVILYQVGGTDTAPTLTSVESDTLPTSGTVTNPTPEMVAVGLIGGTLKAAVSLERTDSVAIYNLDLSAGATNRMQRDRIVALNPGTAPLNSPARGPEGIAIATASTELSYIVTANAGTDTGGPSQNISVIRAATTQDTPPPPAGRERLYLPLIQK